MQESNDKIEQVIDVIIDDLWVDTFCFLHLTDLLNICRTCKHFNNISQKHARMNVFWEVQCNALCSNIKMNKFKPKDVDYNWYQFYVELRQFLLTNKYIEKHEINNVSGPVRLLQVNSHILPTSFPLAIICGKDYVHVFQMFLCNMNNVNAKIVTGSPNRFSSMEHPFEWTLLQYCIKTRSNQIVNYLLSEKILIDFPKCSNIDVVCDEEIYCNYGDTPLAMACMSMNENLVKLLLNHPNMTEKGINLVYHSLGPRSGCNEMTIFQWLCVTNRWDTGIAKMLCKDERTDVSQVLSLMKRYRVLFQDFKQVEKMLQENERKFKP